MGKKCSVILICNHFLIIWLICNHWLIQLLVDLATRAASSVRILWNEGAKKDFFCKFLYEHILSFVLGKYFRVEWFNHIERVHLGCFLKLKNKKKFDYLTFPPVHYDSYRSCPSSPPEEAILQCKWTKVSFILNILMTNGTENFFMCFLAA